LALPALCVIVSPILPLGRAIGDMLVTIVVFPALFWIAALAPVPPGAQVWLKRLGALSFPLYAIHLPLLEAIASIDSTVPAMLLAIVAALTGAFLVDRAKVAMARRTQIRTSPMPAAAYVT